MKIWIDRLRRDRSLAPDGYLKLLGTQDTDAVEYLHRQAREVSLQQFGHDIYIRGLIEVGNRCRNNCLYCGIQAANPSVARYELTKEEILDCCRKGYELGFRTFVLQGGRKPEATRCGKMWSGQSANLIPIAPLRSLWAR